MEEDEEDLEEEAREAVGEGEEAKACRCKEGERVVGGERESLLIRSNGDRER